MVERGTKKQIARIRKASGINWSRILFTTNSTHRRWASSVFEEELKWYGIVWTDGELMTAHLGRHPFVALVWTKSGGNYIQKSFGWCVVLVFMGTRIGLTIVDNKAAIKRRRETNAFLLPNLCMLREISEIWRYVSTDLSYPIFTTRQGLTMMKWIPKWFAAVLRCSYCSYCFLLRAHVICYHLWWRWRVRGGGP